jgi:surface carbohydrate biosynthesis protein
VNTDHPILLIADHKWRDLPGLALLKVWLEERHSTRVVIVHYSLWAGALAAFRPSVVCLPTVTGPREQEIARVAHASGAAVVVIPSEGIPGDRELLPIVACEHVDLSNVDLWLGWSEHVREYQVAHSSLRPDQIVTTGVNRFDFYVPPYRSHLLAPAELRRRYGLRADSPLVTWATNYGHAGYAKTSTEAFIEHDWKVRGLTAYPHYSDPRKYARADARVMEHAHDAMLEVFQRFPHVDFIVKTHPAERLDIYLAYMARIRAAGVRNVALVNREYIGDVLNGSSLHIHRYCTTGIEAWMMGVPTLSLHSDDWHLDASSGGSGGEAAHHEVLVSSIDDISEGVAHYLAGGTPTAQQRVGRATHLQRWLFRVDGQSSCRQAAILADLAASRQRSIRVRPLTLGRSLKGAARGLAAMAVNRLAGRPFDAAIARRRVAGPEVNELGYIDRVTRQPDIDRWCQILRPAVHLHDRSPAAVPAIEENEPMTAGAAR